jgi:hypothetical protein
MTSYAKFDIEGVKKILEHSKKNPIFTPTFSQMFDARYRKDGKDFVETEGKPWPKPEDVDETKTPRQFSLVKDDGIYIMAGTKERLPGEDTHNFVVYAEGYDPKKDDDVWMRSREAVGGDDFSEGLPLEWLEMAVANAEASGIDMMIIKVTKTGMELMTTTPRKRS